MGLKLRHRFPYPYSVGRKPFVRKILAGSCGEGNSPAIQSVGEVKSGRQGYSGRVLAIVWFRAGLPNSRPR
jgi:hypothetical protein